MAQALISKAKPQCRAAYQSILITTRRTHLKTKNNYLGKTKQQVYQIAVYTLVLNLKAMTTRLIRSWQWAKICCSGNTSCIKNPSIALMDVFAKMMKKYVFRVCKEITSRMSCKIKLITVDPELSNNLLKINSNNLRIRKILRAKLYRSRSALIPQNLF